MPLPAALPGQPARLLLVEDDPRLAAFLDRALSGAGYRVDLRTDAQQALAAAAAQAPDIVLLDLNEPSHDRPALARCLRTSITAPILVLSADAALSARVAALDAGADDFLAKPYALPELLARVRALLRGRALAAAQAHGETRRGRLSYADVQLDQDTREASRAGRRLVLRYLTFELLRYFLRHPERVLSRQELLEHVWGYPLVEEAASGAGCNVVDVTVSRLRKALEADGEPRLIHTVRPIGYILRAPRPSPT